MTRIKNIFPNIFCIYIFILPLVVWQRYYEGPKIFLFLIFGFCLSVFWIYRILVVKKQLFLTTADYFYLAWLLILAISGLFGIHPYESIVGASYRHQGVIFFLTLFLTYKTVEILDKNKKKTLNKLIGLSVIVESLIIFIQYSFGKLYFGKALGTVGEGNAVAGFLAIGSYFILQNFPGVIWFLPIMSIFIEESFSGMLSLIPNLFFIFKNFSVKIQKYIYVLSVIIAILILVFANSIKNTSIFENRITIWKLGIMQILQKPLLGFGAESGEAVYQKAFSNIYLPLNGLVIDRSHNLFIDVTMWSGAIGLILFTAFIWQRFKKLDKYGKFAMFSFLIYSMFQPVSIVHWLLFILL